MTRKEALEYLKHRFMETGSPLNPSWESLEELKRHYGAIGIAISALEQQVPKQPDLEGDDAEPSTRSQPVDKGVQGIFQYLQFSVAGNPNRLKRSFGGMSAFFPHLCRNRRPDNVV